MKANYFLNVLVYFKAETEEPKFNILLWLFYNKRTVFINLNGAYEE